MHARVRTLRPMAIVDLDHADRLRAQAQELLNTIQVRFGIEGLVALEQCHPNPGHVEPHQQEMAAHIRAVLGPDVFWLSEALALWRNSQ